MSGTPELTSNRTLQILQAAERGNYAVPAVVCYNLEAILATKRAAERLNAPCLLLLFPWALTYADNLLPALAAEAARAATAPLAVHLDHATDPPQIRAAAASTHFDSIMVDMSHAPTRAENLAQTAALTTFCHARGVAVEAEPGRIEGGEDGLVGPAGDEVLTTPDEVDEFCAAGVDLLAPAFGNVHGRYPPGGPRLEWDRLEGVYARAREKGVPLVLHGTSGFSDEQIAMCVDRGVRKVNVNKVVTERYKEVLREKGGRVGMTEVMEEGTSMMAEAVEAVIRACRCEGKGVDVLR